MAAPGLTFLNTRTGASQPVLLEGQRAIGVGNQAGFLSSVNLRLPDAGLRVNMGGQDSYYGLMKQSSNGRISFSAIVGNWKFNLLGVRDDAVHVPPAEIVTRAAEVTWYDLGQGAFLMQGADELFCVTPLLTERCMIASQQFQCDSMFNQLLADALASIEVAHATSVQTGLGVALDGSVILKPSSATRSEDASQFPLNYSVALRPDHTIAIELSVEITPQVQAAAHSLTVMSRYLREWRPVVDHMTCKPIQNPPSVKSFKVGWVLEPRR